MFKTEEGVEGLHWANQGRGSRGSEGGGKVNQKPQTLGHSCLCLIGGEVNGRYQTIQHLDPVYISEALVAGCVDGHP